LVKNILEKYKNEAKNQMLKLFGFSILDLVLVGFFLVMKGLFSKKTSKTTHHITLLKRY